MTTRALPLTSTTLRFFAGSALLSVLFLLISSAQAAGVWVVTGSMTTARINHTTTLLADGKILVAGGCNGSGCANSLTSAELYDPISGIWSSTGSMSVERQAHTAILLSNGKVLVLGGCNGSSCTNSLSSTELYDPATGQWSTTGSMNIARHASAAVLLPNSRVMVIGGWNVSPLNSTELFDPSTGTWTAASSMNTAHGGHTATLLSNGKVLVVGGDDTAHHYLSEAELYDPLADQWTNTGSLNTARYRHTATLLPNGNVLVVAGVTNGDTPLTSAERYDPATGQWSAAGNLTAARSWHTATLLPSGNLLIVGGCSDFGCSNPLNSAELYDLATGQWSTAGNLNTSRYGQATTLLPNGQALVTGGGLNASSALASAELYTPSQGSWTLTGSLSATRGYLQATVLPDGQVLVTGGESGSGTRASAELYNPLTGQWSVTGDLNTARYGYTATLLPNGKVLVAGGCHSGGCTSYANALSSAELYDPTSGQWTSTGSLKVARYWHMATLLSDGQVLVAGGANSSPQASAELYDPATGQWTLTGSLSVARESATLTLLPDGQALMVGGWSGGSHLNSAELYNPITGQWTVTGNLSAGRRSHTATLLANGQVLVTGGFNGSRLSDTELYNPTTGQWTPTGDLTTGREMHTATLLPDGKVLVAGGQDAGNGWLNSVELYDPAIGMWTTLPSLNVGRFVHAAAWLPNGSVLVVGGQGSSGYLNSAEIYDLGLGFDPAWRPILAAVTSPLWAGQSLQSTGSRFHGISEASGGTYQSSATDYPLVQLRRLDNQQLRWLLPDPAINFSDTSFISLPVTDFPIGPAMVTVFTNGVPSVSKITQVQGLPQPTLSLTKTAPITASAGQPITYTLTVTNTGAATATQLLITDTLPLGAIYLNGGSKIGQVISWTVTSLPPGSASQVSFAVSATQTITNSDYRVSAEGGYSAVGSVPISTSISSNPPLTEQACLLYGVHDEAEKDSQLFTVDLQTMAFQPLGPQYDGYDLEGLDLHPTTGDLYAVGGNVSPNNRGPVYQVDKGTGGLTLLGYTGYGDLTGASFRPTDNSLWLVAQPAGQLLSVNVGNVTQPTLHSALLGNVEAVAWNPGGSLLYAARERSLHAYNPANNRFERVCANAFPGLTEALEFQPDGVLMGSTHRKQGGVDYLNFFTFDINTCTVIKSNTYAVPYYDTESFTFGTQPCGVFQPLVGELSGQVKAADNTPLAGISVEAYQFNNTWWDVVASTQTQANGSYSLSLGQGIYRVHFSDPAGVYLSQYYNHTQVFTQAAQVTVSASTTTSNINARMETPPPPAVQIEGNVNQSVDPQTGQVNLSTWNGSSMTINRTITCASGVPANVTLKVGNQSFPMTETLSGSGHYSVTLTAGGGGNLATQGQFTMSVQWQCAGQPQAVTAGQVTVRLYDPSGQITNAQTGQEVPGARVTLYRLPGAFPDTSGLTRTCRTIETRSGSDWNNEPVAETGLGVLVNPDLSQEISPTVNPQVTGSEGRYAWDVAEGCWYVVVQASGYETKISPLVGVPPAVTDLNLSLQPQATSGPVFLPIITKQ